MIISQTPLRLSLAGGGTDFREFFRQHGGAVLSMAIDKYVYIVLKERFDDRIYVNYSKKETVDDVDEVQHDLVREAMRKTDVRRGIEITTLADVPSEGSGLGSSSSILVGLLNALYAYQGQQVTAERLAREACEIEIDILKRPIGVQDQYIAAYGNLRFFSFCTDGTIAAEKIDLPLTVIQELRRHLLLFYTDRTRNASDILTEQRSNIGSRIRELSRLREMAREARDFLKTGAIDAIGEVLHQSWLLKQAMAHNITDTRIDEMYLRAREAGATGGKIAGAGGGGFLLLYCPLAFQRQVRTALEGYRELPIGLSRHGSKIILNV